MVDTEVAQIVTLEQGEDTTRAAMSATVAAPTPTAAS